MEKSVIDLLEGKGENYILPFFWQHGETEEVLREYMSAIQDSGIGAVCVEARPHPDFVGPQWWKDMDIIMEEARNRNMKVWVLDDEHFPTGFANGAVAKAEPELCKQYAMIKQLDVCGPIPQISLKVEDMVHYTPTRADLLPGAKRIFDDDKLISVIASKLVVERKMDATLLDLTDKLVDGILEWDVPEGMWRINIIFNTRNGGEIPDYINIIDRASCRLQIDAVYEPHFNHYKNDFGKTFAGFFSDEPLFGNVGGYNFDESIGRKRMPLPWNKDVPVMLEEALGVDWKRMLPALWADVDDEKFTAKVRYAYMDAVTKLVEKNFSRQLGEWCEKHGVQYIGHIIEDDNQHSRLGSSLGHFFRALAGQHMSGIDDIGNQVLIGGENHMHDGFVKGEGEFYHFALGKLGSSLGHIDPKKKGRSLCEIYGAYGWSEGVRLMKYLTDHFVVRGINYYVPHAFSPKDFPDTDCPPHFYAHGLNPQYRHFGKLMRYLNRLCHIFNDGLHIAPAVILYPGEAEWTGKHMFLQKPARELLEHQIDFDIIPSDLFADMGQFNASFDGTLKVNGEEYRTLIIPYAEFVTSQVAEFALSAKSKGFEVVFVDGLPSGICNGKSEEQDKNIIEAMKLCSRVALKDLATYLTGKEIYDIQLSSEFKHIRYYHYKKENDIFMFSNEHPAQTFEGDIVLNVKGNPFIYDAMDNLLRPVDSTLVKDGTKIRFKLEPYESVVVVFGELKDEWKKELKEAPGIYRNKALLDGEWKFSVATSKEYPNFHDDKMITKLDSIGKILPDFSGFMRYEKEFCLAKCSKATLEIENAYEGVEVWVNNQYVGMKICPPYRFDISESVKEGNNAIRIEVANTLDRAVQAMSDGMRYVTILEPSGIVGNVLLYTK